MTSASSNLGVCEMKHHDDYYFRDGNIRFVVDSTLFRIHRFFFDREPNHLIPSSGDEESGTSDPYRIPTDDATTEEFADFLWVWYNPRYTYSGRNKTQWLTVLRLANLWGFTEIKKLAIRQLEMISFDPIEKIATYKKYSVDEALLLPSYVSLCTRRRLASPQEGEMLTMRTVLMLAAAREQAIICASERGLKTPTAESLPDDIINGVVADLLGLTPHSNDRTVQMEGQTGNSSGDGLVDKDVITVKEPVATKKGKSEAPQKAPQPSPAPTTNGVSGKGKHKSS